MSEMEYKPNSHAYKERMKKEAQAEKKVEKVVKGKVKTKKKGELAKLADVFIAEDAKTVSQFLITDVVIPAVINLVEDIVIKGLRMSLRGDAGRSSKNSNIDYVSYGKYSNRRDGDRYNSAPRTRSNYGFDKIFLESRGEAEEVLAQMDALIETYNFASIADLNDLLGIDSEYTDNNYGWSNLRNAEAVRTRDGYMLKLPRAVARN